MHYSTHLNNSNNKYVHLHAYSCVCHFLQASGSALHFSTLWESFWFTALCRLLMQNPLCTCLRVCGTCPHSEPFSTWQLGRGFQNPAQRGKLYFKLKPHGSLSCVSLFRVSSYTWPRQLTSQVSALSVVSSPIHVLCSCWKWRSPSYLVLVSQKQLHVGNISAQFGLRWVREALCSGAFCFLTVMFTEQELLSRNAGRIK